MDIQINKPKRIQTSLSRLALVGLMIVLLGTSVFSNPVQAAQEDRLNIAVIHWANDQPLSWRCSMGPAVLWEHVFDPFLITDPKTYEETPGLFTEWSPSDDHKVWTFKLRRGVQFHENWGELTAEDVKFYFEQFLGPNGVGYQAKGYWKKHLERAEAPDKYTVRLHFKSPRWDVLMWLDSFSSLHFVYPKKYIEKVGEKEAALHPIGTGPYKFVEGKLNDWYLFERVADHWRVNPGFKEMMIKKIPDPATQLAALRAGEIDIAMLDGDYLSQAKKAGLRIVERKNALEYWVNLPGMAKNGTEGYCAECPWVGDWANNDTKSMERARKVRMALNLAINKRAIVEYIWHGFGNTEPFSYWYYPAHRGYSTEWKILPYDPEKAKQLLAEAGYPDGFEITMNLVPYNPDTPDIMELVAQAWEEIGLKIKRRNMELAQFYPALRARQNIGAWCFGYNGSSEPIRNWTTGINPEGGSYCLLAERPYHSRAIEAINNELNTDKRWNLQRDFGQYLHDQYYGIQIGMKSLTYGVSKKVGEWPKQVPLKFSPFWEYVGRAKK